jgi:hypothetical protein
MPETPENEPFSTEAVRAYLMWCADQITHSLEMLSITDVNPRTTLELAALGFGSEAAGRDMPDVGRWVTNGVRLSGDRHLSPLNLSTSRNPPQPW